MNSNIRKWSGAVVDAYAHIGDPKYGSPENLALFLKQLNIDKGIVVLGPGLPDFSSIMQVKEKFGDNIKFMGIPFGETTEQRMELGELQIKMGISGMRLMPFELSPNKELIDRLGEEGLWLFAINPYASCETTKFLLEWLDRYPDGKVASPHFLVPKTINEKVEEPSLFRKLLKHPRFHAILSRQGGVESSKPYPHEDLLSWVQELAELVTFKRMMWGSEFPIIYQRNEQPELARDWLLNLGIKLSEEEKEDFYFNNAQRLFFDIEPKSCENLAIPQWVDKQIDNNSKVELFPNNSIYLPMDCYGILLTDYLKMQPSKQLVSFSEYFTEKLCKVAMDIRNNKEV